MDGQLKEVKAQLRSSSGRSSKLIKDGERIEAVVEVAGAGTLVLYVDGSGGYSLRGYPEGDEAPTRDLLAVGVMRAERIVAVHLEGHPQWSTSSPKNRTIEHPRGPTGVAP